MAILKDHELRLNRPSFKSLREVGRFRARELTGQFSRGSNDRSRRSSVQLQRNVNPMLLQHSRGDKAPIELFLIRARALALQSSITDVVRIASRFSTATGCRREYAFDPSMRFSLTSVDETDARRAVARVGPTSGRRRRPRRNFRILRYAIDSANSAEKALIHA